MHNPFEKLKELDLKAAEQPSGSWEKLQPPTLDIPQDLSDAEAFAWAMRDVIRRKWDETCPTSLPTHTTSSVIHPDAEALRELQSLVDGEAPFDLSNSDEYIERAVAIGAKPLLRKLRRGQYAIQAVLDLHGMDREEARHSVESFILRAVGLGRGCVKIIHGRGHNSKENRAVLKELLQLWLATRRMSRYVLAYTSARPCDGGAGAVYVLLRRPHRGR